MGSAISSSYRDELIARLNQHPRDILTWDPGETTGMAGWYKNGEFRHGVFSVHEMRCLSLNTFVGESQTWVVEDYHTYPWKSQQVGMDKAWPARVIGMLEVQAFYTGSEILYQSAQEAKSAVDNNLIKAVFQVNYQTKDLAPHQWDALRHLVLFATKLPPSNGGSD